MKKRTYTAEFKSQVAVEAIRCKQTISQIASKYEVHPSQVTAWKKQALGFDYDFLKASWARPKGGCHA